MLDACYLRFGLGLGEGYEVFRRLVVKKNFHRILFYLFQLILSLIFDEH